MRHPLFFFALPLATLASLSYLTVAKAQITPDNSLGAENSVVTPNVQIKDIPSDRIDGGAIRGGNLFHSFQEFNINAGRGAYFSNPAGIANILTRVTGGNFSNIQGVLGVLGSANLFLINPNGIFFGPNARLDVGGSFLGSTANSLIFKNGFEFSATNPQAPPLLTINVPIGLGFRNNPGTIRVQDSGQSGGLDGATGSFSNPTLAVNPGETLTLVGGNVSLEGGVLQTPGGYVELGGLAAAGVVELKNGSLSFPVGVQRADVSLTNQAGINVIADEFGGGSININARNIGISGESLLTAGIASNLGTVNYRAGDITLDATGETRIDQSRIENNVNTGTSANSRNINIKTDSFVLTSSQLSGSNFGSSEEKLAGDVIINARDQVFIENSSIFSQGRFGRLFIGQPDSNDPSLIPSSVNIDNSTISTTNSGTEFAGDIKINARDQISIKSSEISSQGRFGRIFIGQTDTNATSSSFIPSTVNINNSTLSTTNSGTERAGDIKINARDQISIKSSEISSQGRFGRIFIGQPDSNDPSIIPASVNIDNSTLSNTNSGTELAGDIKINARDQVFIINNSKLSSTNFDTGFAGDIAINAGNQISIKSSEISSQGRFGRILIGQPDTNATSPSFVASTVNINNSTLSTTNSSTERAGDIKINAREQVFIINNSKLSSTNFDTGFAGDIAINAGNQILITDSTFFSEGKLGKILIGQTDTNATSSSFIPSTVNIDNSTLSTTHSDTERAGNIKINARDQVFINNSRLSTTNFDTGFAGDITINAGNQISIKSSGIFSRGRFGYVLIGKSEISGETSSPKVVSLDGSTISITNDSVTSANERQINAGSISIDALDSISLNRSAIVASTQRKGNAGDVTLRAENGNISLTGESNIFSTVEAGGIGKGGDITIFSRSLSLTDGAQITASSAGNGAAGNIEIIARSIRLDNGSTISANTVGGQGNIKLSARDFLLLRRGSKITTNATGLATGGNITINTGNLVAFPQEDSDITADAQQNSGGQIKINASGIFGIQYRPVKTEFSDITAISELGPEFNGRVEINTSLTDPSQGLFELSEAVIDPAQQIAQNPCTKGFGSSFTIVGRGGFPTDPKKIISSDNVRVDLVQPVVLTVSSTSTSEKQSSQQPTVKKIIPAQGWIYNEKGEVLLVGYDPTKTGPQRQQPAPASSCAAR